MQVSFPTSRAVPADNGVRDVRQAADVPARAPLPPGPLQRQRRAHLARPHRVRLLRGARHGLHRLQGGTDSTFCNALSIKSFTR